MTKRGKAALPDLLSKLPLTEQLQESLHAAESDNESKIRTHLLWLEEILHSAKAEFAK